eukprot:TRINITY_DN1589_c0_g1_i1.p1 TRINITY_DN1589_c0_g1~~TRINITY_DN1589_c0_g1_i1.p1  ORF type:complete len:1355 (+),score=405.59 TRINITY_DN1589_c0_g1_i1:36-4100(+)
MSKRALLKISVVEAYDLVCPKKKSKNLKPYVRVLIQDQDGRSLGKESEFKTNVTTHKTLVATWNQSCLLATDKSATNTKLVVQVFEDDALIGHLIQPITTIQSLNDSPETTMELIPEGRIKMQIGWFGGVDGRLRGKSVLGRQQKPNRLSMKLAPGATPLEATAAPPSPSTPEPSTQKLTSSTESNKLTPTTTMKQSTSSNDISSPKTPQDSSSMKKSTSSNDISSPKTPDSQSTFLAKRVSKKPLPVPPSSRASQSEPIKDNASPFRKSQQSLPSISAEESPRSESEKQHSDKQHHSEKQHHHHQQHVSVPTEDTLSPTSQKALEDKLSPRVRYQRFKIEQYDLVHLAQLEKTVTDLTKSLEDEEHQIRDLEMKLEELHVESDEKSLAVDEIDQLVEQRNSAIDFRNEEVSKLEEELSALQAELDGKQARMDKLETVLKKFQDFDSEVREVLGSGLSWQQAEEEVKKLKQQAKDQQQSNPNSLSNDQFAGTISHTELIEKITNDKDILDKVTEVKSHLSSAHPVWLIKFLENGGLDSIYNVLNKVEKMRNPEFQILVKASQLSSCLRVMMNNQSVLDYILRNMRETFKALVDLSLNSKNTLIKSQMLILMSGLCLYSKLGLKVVQNTVKFLGKSPRPYFILTKMMKEERETGLITACITLINALIAGEKELGSRTKIRRVFVDGEVETYFDPLREKYKNDRQLICQLDAYEELKRADEEKLRGLQFMGKMDLENPGSIFERLLIQAEALGVRKVFMSFLQHLLLLPQSEHSVVNAFLLIERAVRRITKVDSAKKINSLTSDQIQFEIQKIYEFEKQILLLQSKDESKGADSVPTSEPSAAPPPPAPPAPKDSKSTVSNTYEPPTYVPDDDYSSSMRTPRRENRQLKNLADSRVAQFWSTIKASLENSSETDEVIKYGADEKLKKGAPQKIALLPVQMANNISILRAQFRNMADVDILTCILDVKRKSFTTSQLEALLKCIPSDEMIDCLLGYDGEMDELRAAERFTLTLLTIDNVAEKLRSLILRDEFEQRATNIQNQINIIKKACSEIMTSKKLQGVFGVILTMGNFLNYGTQHGRAKGLHTLSLTKLVQLRSTMNPRYNLLDFLVEFIETHCVEYNDFYKQIPHLEQASKYQWKVVRTEIKELQEGLSTILEQLDLTPDEEKHGIYAQYFEVMDSFIKRANNQLMTIEQEYMDSQELSRKVLETFGHSPAEPIQEVLTQLVQFVKKYKDIVRGREEQAEELERMQRMGWFDDDNDDTTDKKDGDDNKIEKKVPKKLGILDQTIACITRGDFGYEEQQGDDGKQTKTSSAINAAKKEAAESEIAKNTKTGLASNEWADRVKAQKIQEDEDDD